MSLLPVKRDPSRADLVGLGLAIAALTAIAGLSTGAWIAWAAGGALALLFALAPRRVYLAWQYAFWPVGWLVSHVALAIVFFGVVTPIGLAMRALGRDPMARKRAASYWRPRAEPPVDRYFHTY